LYEISLPGNRWDLTTALSVGCGGKDEANAAIVLDSTIPYHASSAELICIVGGNKDFSIDNQH